MGCTKVSAACKHCYAERDMDHRFSKVRWGPSGTRTRTAASNWEKPLQWHRKAEQSGTRQRVFCASLADVFESWTSSIHDHKQQVIESETMGSMRQDLFNLIDQTPWLDRLLLPKRPENIIDMWPGCYRSNVWLGCTAETQQTFDNRPLHLAAASDLAAITFISAEPLLGRIQLGKHADGIDWIITGGESGPEARASDSD